MEIVAQVVDGGKTGLVATMFGLPDTSRDRDLLDRHYSNSRLINVSDSFHNSLSMLTEAYTGEETMRISKQIVAHHGSLFNHNVLMYLNDNNFTNPNTMMKSIISSHPEVIRLDMLGVISGFEDASPDDLLYDYVYQGDLNIVGSDAVYNTISDSNYDEIYDVEDLAVIRHTFHIVENYLNKGLDPTDEGLRPF